MYARTMMSKRTTHASCAGMAAATKTACFQARGDHGTGRRCRSAAGGRSCFSTMIAMSSTLFALAAEAHPARFTFDGAASFTSRSESTATARTQASLSSLRSPDFTELMTEEDPMTRQQNQCAAPSAAARPAPLIRLDNVTKAYQGSVTKAFQEGGWPA